MKTYSALRRPSVMKNLTLGRIFSNKFTKLVIAFLGCVKISSSINDCVIFFLLFSFKCLMKKICLKNISQL